MVSNTTPITVHPLPLTDREVREALYAKAARWSADADFIDGSKSGTRVRRAIASETLRACAREVRETLDRWPL